MSSAKIASLLGILFYHCVARAGSKSSGNCAFCKNPSFPVSFSNVTCYVL